MPSRDKASLVSTLVAIMSNIFELGVQGNLALQARIEMFLEFERVR